jgi:hypothetical protein
LAEVLSSLLGNELAELILELFSHAKWNARDLYLLLMAELL